MRRIAIVTAALLCCLSTAALARQLVQGKEKQAIVGAIRRAHDIGPSQTASCMRVYVSTVNRNWATMEFIFNHRCAKQDANGISIVHRTNDHWRFVTAGSSFSCPIPGHIPPRVQKDLKLSCMKQ